MNACHMYLIEMILQRWNFWKFFKYQILPQYPLQLPTGVEYTHIKFKSDISIEQTYLR